MKRARLQKGKKRPRTKLGSKRWLKSVERYYTRGNEPIGDAVRELTIDDIRSLL